MGAKVGDTSAIPRYETVMGTPAAAERALANAVALFMALAMLAMLTVAEVPEMTTVTVTLFCSFRRAEEVGSSSSSPACEKEADSSESTHDAFEYLEAMAFLLVLVTCGSPIMEMLRPRKSARACRKSRAERVTPRALDTRSCCKSLRATPLMPESETDTDADDTVTAVGASVGSAVGDGVGLGVGTPIGDG